jgi:hypothetical protein
MIVGGAWRMALLIASAWTADQPSIFPPCERSTLQIQIENVAREELYASWCVVFDRT